MMIAPRPIAIYVHVPFCQARCSYCDFNTYAGLVHLIPDYTAAVRRELHISSSRWGALQVATVYFGGGTPSLLPASEIGAMLETIASAFNLTPDAEITLEANPGTITAPYLHSLHKLGVNRLSLGVQSAQDSELKLLGRIHTWATAVAAIQNIRTAGFDNLSLDLIFGLPEQSLDQWQHTLERVLVYQPEHLSLYALSIEPDTPLECKIHSGSLPTPDDDTAADMYELAESTLAQAGYFHYEISNWARCDSSFRCNLSETEWWPNSMPLARRRPLDRHSFDIGRSERISQYVSHHNLTYWRNSAWIGAGAGAHSWISPTRWSNELHPQAYIAAIRSRQSAVTELEHIDTRLEMGETMMMGLRLAEGVSDEQFSTRFSVHLVDACGAEISTLQRQGLLLWDGCSVRLTAQGRLLGNQVFARFL